MAQKKSEPRVLEAISAIEPPADIFRSGAELNATTVNFLKIDLDTARTFADIALHAQDSDKRERNRQHARIGYDTVLRLLPRVSPGPADARIMAKKIEQLKADLMELGETF